MNKLEKEKNKKYITINQDFKFKPIDKDCDKLAFDNDCFNCNLKIECWENDNND